MLAGKQYTFFSDLAWGACALCMLLTGCPNDTPPPTEAQALEFAGASPYSVGEQVGQFDPSQDHEAARVELRQALAAQETTGDIRAPEFRQGPAPLISEPDRTCASGG